MKTEAYAKNIQDMRVQVKIVEDKEGNRDILTQITFLTTTDPDTFTPILRAIANRHNVDVLFASNQLTMEV